MNVVIYENIIVAANNLFFECKKRLVSLLAAKIGVPEDEVFYTWCERKTRQSGSLNEYYKYFFHGYECDFRGENGEYIRVEFGPCGRVDTFTSYGLSSFIKTCLIGICNIYPDLMKEDRYDEFFHRSSLICQVKDYHFEMNIPEFDESVSHRLIINPLYNS